MKKTLFALTIALMGGGISAQNFTSDFEPIVNGNTGRGPYVNNCWEFWGTDIKSTDAINGFSTRSGQATSLTNKKQVRTPFLQIDAGATLSFKHKISAYRNADTRILDVVLVSPDGTESAPFYTHTYSSGNVVNTTAVTIPATGEYRVAFQLYGQGGQGRGHIDDLVITNASYVSDPANNCLPASSCTDSDNDQVCDADDDFPNDPDKAYIVYAPAEEVYGSVVFEDLWPAYGDFDFNDAVVDWNAEAHLNADNEVVSIVSRFYPRAVGAGFQNGFAFGFPLMAAGEVASVNGSDLNENYITLAANGTEDQQSTAVFIVSDNLSKSINRASGASFHNTVKGEPAGDADTIVISIELNTPQSQLVAGGKTDFLLIKNQDRNTEIHLPGGTPTDLASTAAYGTADDDSNGGLSYNSVDNLPWGLIFYEKFDYPAEKHDITQAYNFFASWAQSGGTLSPDWYKNLSGYRNSAKLY